jgi:hypothetical protein
LNLHVLVTVGNRDNKVTKLVSNGTTASSSCHV